MKKKFLTAKALFLLIPICLFLSTKYLSHYLTDGFRITSISSNIPVQENWEVAILEQDEKETEKALSQDYYYLTSGSQSYVFESTSGEYILKFFKQKRWRLHPFYALLPLPENWEKKRTHWKKKKWETVNDTFLSCKISYELFKDQTGVIFVHLNRTNHLQTTLLVKDRIGFTHRLPLDNLPFVIQKKAIPTDQYLLTLRATGNLNKAKQAIQEMLLFTRKRAELGFSDKDPHLIRNFGFIDNQAVEIDIGGFHKDPKKGLSYYKSREIFKIEEKLLPWIQENYPELTDYIQEQVNLLSD